ncbi:response regulator transcription factor [Telmatospirillum sp. J64-1]|uniref:response regulator transcription factor n=1 Tax=Telmatospirillum sp. J64-1 TaxID=2502183 RepID=UPI00115E896C|nr:response regulator [Telmatospirillum sp. J64-1]
MTEKQETANPTVFIIDDDEAVRDSLAALVEAAGFAAETYESALLFLHRLNPSRPGCIVADLRMPGMSGLELQEELVQRGIPLPIIVITAHGEVSSAVLAFRGGAVDFLEKPFDDEIFLQRVQEAMVIDERRRREEEAARHAASLVAGLSAREREVAALMVEGCPNKIIANRLDIGVRTVETHRARVLEKLGINNIADLIRLWMQARP